MELIVMDNGVFYVLNKEFSVCYDFNDEDGGVGI